MQTHSCEIKYRREKSPVLAQLQMPQGRQKMSNTKITLKHCSSHEQKEITNVSHVLTYLTHSPLVHYKKARLMGTQDQWLCGVTPVTPVLGKGCASKYWCGSEDTGTSVSPFPHSTLLTVLLWHGSKAKPVCSMLFSLSNTFPLQLHKAGFH